MKSNTVTATINPRKRVKTTMFIIIYAVLALFSLVMGFYDIATDKVLFGILFLIASLIFIILLLINGNAVFGTYLRFRDGKLYMKSWPNYFLPYNMDGGFFSDLKPSKTKLTSIPADEISSIHVGTKDYIKRNISDAGKKFIRAIYPYEHSSKKSRRNMITGIDIFYIETVSNNCAFMCIQDFAEKKVVDVMHEISLANPNVTIKVNSREYKKHIQKLNAEG